MPYKLNSVDQATVTERLVLLYPALKAVVTAYPAFLTELSSPSCFESLVSAIIHQQISTTVGRSIMGKLSAFASGSISPTIILGASEQDLQQLGISRQKRGYLNDLALKFKENPEWETILWQLSDHDVVTLLTQVKGIGVWSAEMFLMFHLKRADVWPVTDLGIRKAIMHHDRLADLPSITHCQQFGQAAQGIRSALAWYLWRYISLIERAAKSS